MLPTAPEWNSQSGSQSSMSCLTLQSLGFHLQVHMSEFSLCVGTTLGSESISPANVLRI